MPPLNQSLKFGLISGLILITYAVVLYAFDINIFGIAFSIINGLISFGLMILFTVIGINKTRNIQLSGKITYIQAVIAGFVVLLISGYLNSIFSYFLQEVIDPEYIARQIDNFFYTWEGKMPEEALEQTITKLEEQMNPKDAFLKSLYYNPIFAIILALIVSIFIKKDTTSDSLTA